ncbi:peptidase S10 [Oscillochloris sp. ZM17-4]|uniref:S10 family peptidase n=1 Tax=Oscillochloris sp. ZM17-4 TaxID=2866714 RepID=UPI001C7386E4|nr:peptidase S10 [Oscillochloris sp. ZM17-4]MBX0327375.1 peptidase S10 [Oscillochloris sp. ZM17-4]
MPEQTSGAAPAPAPPTPEDRLVQTHHQIVVGRETLSYTVTAGTMVIREEAEKAGEGTSEGEKARATIFFVAYTRDGERADGRPITFSFNGGPGSSSVWLHMGLLGPRKVEMGDVGALLPPPYRLGDNPHTLLAQSDMVFIDPVSTGFSRAVPGEAAKPFHGFKKDIEAVGDFIRLYTTRYGRWLSPKFLIGESYGTTRAGGLAGYLQERHGLFLNGIMLISAVLNFQTLEFDPGNDLPYILFLPSYAAAAFYHKRLPDDLQADLRATLAEVEAFALGDYALALLRGDTLGEEGRADIAARLSRYTGLSEAYLLGCDLRVRDDRFVRELLRERGRSVGRLDSRFRGIDRDRVGERAESDPSYSAILGPYSAAINAYVRGELGYASDLPYEIISGRVHPWSYAQHENKYVDVAETLRRVRW